MISTIHSKYCFQQLFTFVSEKRKLQITKNNLFLNKKLDLSIIDYKSFFFLKKIKNYNFPYTNNYIEQIRKEFNDIIKDETELNELVINCLSKNKKFNLSFSDINFDLFINNPNIEYNICLNTEDLIKENIPKISLIKDNKFSNKAFIEFQNIFNSFSTNGIMDKNSIAKFLSIILKKEITKNDVNVYDLYSKYNIMLFNGFLNYYYDSIIENIKNVWDGLYNLGYNNELEKTNEIDINYILNNLDNFEKNDILKNLLTILEEKVEKILKLSLISKIDNIFIKYLDQKKIFNNLKKVDISICNLNKMIKLNINFPNVEELYLNIEKKFRYNQNELNNIFPNMKSLIIFLETNFDLINLMRILNNSKIIKLKIFIFNNEKDYEYNSIIEIISNNIKNLQIEIGKGCEKFGFDFLFKLYNYVQFPYLEKYILKFEDFDIFINEINNKILELEKENDFNCINEYLINTLINKKQFNLKFLFNLANKLSLIKYLQLDLQIFSFMYKKQNKDKYLFKFNLNDQDNFQKCFTYIDFSIDENEIIKYKKINIKGINKFYQKFYKDFYQNQEIFKPIEKIIEKEEIKLCDINLSLNLNEYYIKSFKNINSIYCEDEIQKTNLLNLLKEKNLDNLKHINLTLGNCNESSSDQNNIYKFLSEIIKKSEKLKSLILRLNPHNFNENVIFFLNLTQNLKKLKIINITKNIENHDYNLSLENILEKFPQLNENKYYFEEIKIGNLYLIKKNKKNKFPYFNIKCEYLIDNSLLKKQIRLAGENILNGSLLYLNNKKINDFKYKFSKEGNYKLKILFKEFKMNNLLHNCYSLTSINLYNFNTNKITDISGLFSNCTSLKSLNLSNLNTKNISDMNSMFFNCSSLTSLNLSNFFTNKLTNMMCMFSNCSSIKTLDFSNINTSNVTNMNGLFSVCSSLTTLNLSYFNTNKVNNMSGMFSKCTSLKTLNLSNFNTINVTNMSFIFYKCSALNTLNLSNFNTNNVTDMNHMFYKCSSLNSLNISNFNTNNVFDMNGMFSYCSSLDSLELSNFNTNCVTNMNNMFSNCTSLEFLDLSNFNLDNVIDMNEMFSNIKITCKILSKDEKILKRN